MAVIYHPYWPITVPTQPASNELQKKEKKKGKKTPPQWNKSRYRANKLLIAVWDFYLLSCSWQGLKGSRARERRWDCGFSIIWFLWTLVWCTATVGPDGLSSVLNIFEGRFFFLCLGLFVLGETFMSIETTPNSSIKTIAWRNWYNNT